MIANERKYIKEFICGNVLVFFVISALLVYIFYFPVNVYPELIGSYESSSVIESLYWKTISDENSEVLSEMKEKGIKCPEINFKKKNLIISYGYEIELISYKRASQFEHPFKEKTYLGKAKYGDCIKNVIYFYEIKKTNVMYNMFEDGV